jgi:hypothetical protein
MFPREAAGVGFATAAGFAFGAAGLFAGGLADGALTGVDAPLPFDGAAGLRAAAFFADFRACFLRAFFAAAFFATFLVFLPAFLATTFLARFPVAAVAVFLAFFFFEDFFLVATTNSFVARIGSAFESDSMI